MLNSYSPRNVNVSFNGIAITGFAPESFIRIKRNSDLLAETVGSAGELALTHIADKTGEIEIELMQTSSANLGLSALILAMEFQTSLIPVGEIVILDPSGSNFTIAHNAYIKRVPEIDLGATQNTRTWVFGCEELVYTATPAGFSNESGLAD
jgi:hypothetical protein